MTYFVYEGDALLAETDASGTVTRVYAWGALGLVSEHTGGGGGPTFGSNNSGKGGRNSSVPGAVEFPDGRRGRHGAAALCQAGGGGSDTFHLYDTQGNTSALVNGAGALSGSFGMYSPYGGSLNGQGGSAFGWGGQSGAYRDIESNIVMSGGGTPYIPGSASYASPHAGNPASPYQAMGGNPVSYGPGDDGDDGRDMSYAKSGLDAIRRGGGGPKGRQMARDFMNHTVNSIPFGGCLMVLAGQDMMGCKMDGWGRLGNMAQGLASGMPVLGHFGELAGGAATEEAASAAANAAREDEETLYRGVPKGHHDYQNMLNGEANPRGGHSDPLLHVAGDTRSEFTSWTTDRRVAEGFAEKGFPLEGKVMEKQFPNSQTIRPRNIFGERERLIRGAVRGARVTRP